MARWLDIHPALEPLVEAVAVAGEAVREATGAAFVTPAEPRRPEEARWRAAAEAARAALARLEAEPSPRRAEALLAALVELRARAHWIAPTRRTSGPVARWAVREAIRLFREAWERLEVAAREAGALPVPWRLAFASHVPPELPWSRAELAGNAVPGVPVAELPWGERCALSGRWYQLDGHRGAPRWRSLDGAGFVVEEGWGAFLERAARALERLERRHPEAAERVRSGFPELGHRLVRERHGETFARLGLADFPSLAVALHNALARFSGRPAFGTVRPDGSGIAWWSFAELRARVLATAHALESAGVAPGARVGVAVVSGRELAYVLDMACALVGAVSVGLDPAWPEEAWLEALEAAGVAVVAGDGEGVRRLAGWGGRRLCLWGEAPAGAEAPAVGAPPPGWRSRTGIGPGTPVIHDDGEGWAAAAAAGIEPDPPEALHTIVFTSGSSGRPKGVPVTRARLREMLRLEAELRPLVAVSYRPYALLADRLTVWRTVLGGGRVGFCRGGAALWEDVGRFAPTFLEGPPAFWRPVVAPYLAAVERGEPPHALAEIALEQRARLGGRVVLAGVGGAAVEPGLREALEELLDCPVHEGYGTSETGPIAQDGVVEPGLEVRILDRPDLGLTSRDEPYPRGELLVRRPGMVRGYVGGSPEDARRFTGDGFFRTGDLVERLPDGRIRVLGREGELVKLASGRFVVPSRVERVVEACPSVREAAALPAPDGSGLVLVVVPSPADAEPEAVRAEVWARLSASGLPRDWMPMAVIVDTGAGDGWTPESGLRTGSLKLRRGELARRYADRIAAALAPPRGSAEPPDPVAWLVGLVARALGRPEEEIPPAATLRELGAGSLAAAEVAAALSARTARALPPEAVMDTPIRDLARTPAEGPEGGRSTGGGGGERVPSPEPDARVAPPLEDEIAADLVRLPLPAEVPPYEEGGAVLVTGATGFLGIHVLAALTGGAGGGRDTVALVRAPDHAAARRRLEAAARAAELDLGEVGTPDDPRGTVVAVAGDLAADRLGLDESLYRRLAREVGAIVHAGAVVRPDLAYRELRDVNVAGTGRVLELATTARLKRFVLVSTLDVTLLAAAAGRGGEEEAPLPERVSASALAAATGYAVSKWAAERMLRMEWLHCRGRLPCVVVRPGPLSWAAATGVANRDDWLIRVLLSCLAVGAIPTAVPAAARSEPVATETAARGVEPLPVDSAAAAVAALARRGGPPPGGALGEPPRLHLVNPNRGAGGLVTWSHLFWLLAAAVLAENPAGAPLRPVPWRDWRGLVVARRAPAAVLLQGGGTLPEYPRARAAAARRALAGTLSAPPFEVDLVRRFVGWAARVQAI